MGKTGNVSLLEKESEQIELTIYKKLMESLETAIQDKIF